MLKTGGNHLETHFDVRAPGGGAFAGGGAAGADPMGEAHEEAAPHSVHSGLRRGGRGLLVLIIKRRACFAEGTGSLC